MFAPTESPKIPLDANTNQMGLPDVFDVSSISNNAKMKPLYEAVAMYLIGNLSAIHPDNIAMNAAPAASRENAKATVLPSYPLSIQNGIL